MRWRGEEDADALREWLGADVRIYKNNVFLPAPEGEARAWPGDYIVKGQDRALIMAPGLFEREYELDRERVVEDKETRRIEIALLFQRALDSAIIFVRDEKGLWAAAGELTRLRFQVGGEKTTRYARERLALARAQIEGDAEAAARLDALVALLDEKDAV